MLLKLKLQTRIYIILGALIAVNLAGSAITLWYIVKTQHLYTAKINDNITALMTAQKLETNLVMQKGYATYFFLDGDNEWLQRLNARHSSFIETLKTARNTTYLKQAHLILNDIESLYIAYSFSRDLVIDMYKKGNREKGSIKHWKVREQFHQIFDLCEQFKNLYDANILKMQTDYKKSARLLTTLAMAAIPSAILLGLLLAFIFLKQIILPIRKMTGDTMQTGKRPQYLDEIKALGQRVHTLIDDADVAKLELEKSREHLIQSEKLALVGKLGAGMAHSIRNPLTSVKMRLFSLERSLRLNPTQKEDMDVISEEIRHIDTIVRSFLEFSRPPKMKFQEVSLSDIVDTTLSLLKYRIDSYGVEIIIERTARLTPIKADPEQIKEVLFNLILNACDALGDGGQIVISEKETESDQGMLISTISVSDNGPGIAEQIQEKVFQPFFSTKEEGTGLGLSIAKRIIEEHGGTIVLRSFPGHGTTFEIKLQAS